MNVKRIEQFFPNTPILAASSSNKSQNFLQELILARSHTARNKFLPRDGHTLAVLRNRAHYRPTEPMLALLAGTFFTILGTRTIRVII